MFNRENVALIEDVVNEALLFEEIKALLTLLARNGILVLNTTVYRSTRIDTLSLKLRQKVPIYTQLTLQNTPSDIILYAVVDEFRATSLVVVELVSFGTLVAVV